ncbi:MAG: hypothetical protein KKD92_10580 [Proteobacteria bacterium]|nr:hypothetical protein [Pseudomonadota bacterium]
MLKVMRNLFTLTIIAIALIGCKTEMVDISRIIVLDSNFNQIRVIDESNSLNQLSKLWKEFEPIDELPITEWTHKLDIESKDLSGRWLYNQEGYLAKLNKQLKPSYKVKNTEAFNKIILGF